MGVLRDNWGAFLVDIRDSAVEAQSALEKSQQERVGRGELKDQRSTGWGLEFDARWGGGDQLWAVLRRKSEKMGCQKFATQECGRIWGTTEKGGHRTRKVEKEPGVI